MAASAAFALKPGVWFRRGRLLIVSPDSLGTACPLSGRNSTYRPVQISGAGSAKLYEIRRAVVEKLTDQTVLAHIAKNDSNSWVRVAASKNLTDRVLAQVVFADIARNDGDLLVRATAAN